MGTEPPGGGGTEAHTGWSSLVHWHGEPAAEAGFLQRHIPPLLSQSGVL